MHLLSTLYAPFIFTVISITYIYILIMKMFFFQRLISSSKYLNHLVQVGHVKIAIIHSQMFSGSHINLG